MRTKAELVAAEQELFERVWYARKQAYLHDIECHGEPIPDEAVFDAMMRECRRLETKYGAKTLMPEDDFDYGVITGKLAALRWMLGTEWTDEGLLDT